jgi:hypothetical protein
MGSPYYRDKEVVGVFVRFRAPPAVKAGQDIMTIAGT